MVAKKTLKSKQKTIKESTEKTVKDLCGFSELNCRCCGKGNDEIGGFLLQCATCKKAHYCSKECFNKDLPKHMEFCQTNEPLHRAPKHRVDQPVTFSSAVSALDDEIERFGDSTFVGTAKKFSLSNLPLKNKTESSLSAPDSTQIASSQSSDCQSIHNVSTVDADCDTQKDAFLDRYIKGVCITQEEGKTTLDTEDDLDNAEIHGQSQRKMEVFADAHFTTLGRSTGNTADLSQSESTRKVLCGASDIRVADHGFRKPKRSTSLPLDEDISDRDSDSTIHMSDMTESDGEIERIRPKIARRNLRRERDPSSKDFASEKPQRFDSSNNLERPAVLIDPPFGETNKALNPSDRGADEGPDYFSLTTDISSFSFSDSSIKSGTDTPYQLQRKKGFIIRRQKGKGNTAVSDEYNSSCKGDGAQSDFFSEEIYMKKRLNNLWSLPEATVLEKRTEKRGKLQLSRSMRREKGRMHRCLGNLWKLSAASRTDKANSGFAFEEWSDFEDSDSEEVRKRRGGGTLGSSDSVTVTKSQRIAAETVSLKHLDASEPKRIGWERPEWTEYQLRSTAEGKLIKNEGNLIALKTRVSDAPEWACHSALRKVSIGSNLRSQKSFTVCSTRWCANDGIEAQKIESFESFGKLKATERGTMLKRVGSIRLSNRKNASCEFSVKRSTSALSRSSSGSISLASNGTKLKNKAVELDESKRKEKNSTVRSSHESITGDDTSQVFDRARILRTTSRGVKLLRGESLRRHHDMQI